MRTSRMALLAGVVAVVAGLAAVIVTAWVLLPSGDRSTRWGGEAARPGDTVTQPMTLRDFDRVELSGRWRVTLTQGDDWAVELTQPERAQRGTSVTVHDGRLQAVHRPRLFSGFGRGGRQQPELTVVMPALAELVMAGATQARLTGFEGDALLIKGAGAVSLSGHASRYRTLDLQLAGAAQVDLHELIVTDANLELAGASRVGLHLDGGVLAGKVVGAGQVAWTGRISEQRVELAGAARVVELNGG